MSKDTETSKDTDRRVGDCIIRRRVYRYAYPRNGNLGMTTIERYCYDLLAADGHLLIPSIPTLREAKIAAKSADNV